MSYSSSPPDSNPIARLEQDVSRLSESLKRAERNVGALQWTISLLIIGCVALAILVRNGVIDLKQIFKQEAIASKVESNRFDLFNREGKRVMLVQNDKYGHPDLIFLDLDLNYKMGITMTPDTPEGTPEIALYGKGGARAQYRLGREGESIVRLLGEDKKGEILMQVTREGIPTFTMKDVNGKVLFHAPEGAPLPVQPSLSPGPRR